MDSTNKPFWLDFIDLYRQNSCLWDVSAKDYTNKMRRIESYNILLMKLQEAIPLATMDSLKKKINNIRTSFRRELKKVLDSKASGSGNVYEPTLWYFNTLSFIAQTEAARKERSDDEDDYVTELVDTNDINVPDFQIKDEDFTLEPDSPEDIADTLIETHEDAGSSILHNASSLRKRRIYTNKFNSFKQKKFAHYNAGQKTNDDDEFMITGKKFAFQLKRMDDRQRIIAEKLISDVMFYGGMGKLSEDAVIRLPLRHVQD